MVASSTAQHGRYEQGARCLMARCGVSDQSESFSSDVKYGNLKENVSMAGSVLRLVLSRGRHAGSRWHGMLVSRALWLQISLPRRPFRGRDVSFQQYEDPCLQAGATSTGSTTRTIRRSIVYIPTMYVSKALLNYLSRTNFHGLIRNTHVFCSGPLPYESYYIPKGLFRRLKQVVVTCRYLL